MTRAWLPWLTALLAFALFLPVPSGGSDSRLATYGRISFLEGSATVGRQDAPFTAAQEGTRIRPGSIVRTAADARAEITFLDGSIVRIDADSEYRVETAAFEGGARSEIKSTLTRGRVWARVAPTASPRRRPFDIVTPSAVIRVRGTVYDLKAEANDATEVSVYDGSVGVSPPLIEEGAAHEEISWPEEVSEDEWEEIILGKLQRLRIGPDGQPEAPTAFSPEDEQDPWVLWNQARDAQGA